MGWVSFARNPCFPIPFEYQYTGDTPDVPCHKRMDKGKQDFELLKALMDKNLVKVDKVKDFIEAMDTILKTL